ncbi:hypothetical protein KOSB73_120016 [Klebsiella grimontii]|uniref:Uncharacterized protein n=1 Tax=Klebsiella grimontii TaxID=2058152 RepID=A0A285AVJ7_9ENTR|nr:hypothetical protein KOSB73_120016 [Klebsiella grimontii]
MSSWKRKLFNYVKWRCCLKKYKAKSVPTFKLPPKGVIMHIIVQKGCTKMNALHQYSAFV